MSICPVSLACLVVLSPFSVLPFPEDYGLVGCLALVLKPARYNWLTYTFCDLTETQHPNLNLTPEEKRVFYQLFQAADKTNLGVITGEVAITFFEKTNLPADILGLVSSCSPCYDHSPQLLWRMLCAGIGTSY